MTVDTVHPATVFIIDDHELVRLGLMGLIERDRALSGCGDTADAAEALARICEFRPDLVLMDVTVRNGDGLELLRNIGTACPTTRVLIVSRHDEDLHAERAIRAGARGFIRNDESARAILDAIRSVLGGRVHVSERLANRLIERVTSQATIGSREPVDTLSDREVEVLQLLGEGLSTREVAERLHLSTKTIHTYREHLKKKLGLETAGKLVRYAVARTLIGA